MQPESGYVSVWTGGQAFWGGHKSGANRISLSMPTYSTAVGMLRSVMGHYGARWLVHETRLLRMGDRMACTTHGLTHYPQDRFTKKRTMMTQVKHLDVTIAIRASLRLSPESWKWEEMFERRMRQGAYFSQCPTMGPKECMCDDFRLAEPGEDLTPLDRSEDMGIQPFGQDFDDTAMPWYYYPMSMLHGVVTYPTWDEVRAYGFRKETPRTLGASR